jgi:hypothetical protein
MNLTVGSKVQRMPGVVARCIAGEVVLVPIHSRAEDLGLFTLNPVGSFIWEKLDGRPLDALTSDVTSRYAVQPDVAARDVLQFAKALVTARCAEIC